MFQNIQQFHSGESNTISFRLLATLFITKNSIDMRILSTELSQLKRIAIINAISNCVCKGCPYRCYILKFNTLANRFECDSKIDEKKGYTLFHLLQTNVIARYYYPFFDFAEEFSFTEKAFINQFSIFYTDLILTKKSHKIKASHFHFLKITY